jgi:MSHA pilin protein MshA
LNTNNKGFTLIELIIVIVVIGILAVTAAPKFINLSKDAHIATLNGLSAQVHSAAQLIFAKSAIKGTTKQATGGIDIDGDNSNDINTVYGYPSSERIGGLAGALELNNQWGFAGADNASGVFLYISPTNVIGLSGSLATTSTILTANCYLTYQAPTTINGSYNITLTTSGC